ncbi:hypothetical protein MUK70_10625 [Dyadobacter chenwenxiniae]|uniref:Uncharacterized protein n=1 Tax=Dyadobacter chenwenxiniae TaxID=2906456 RepID=A0A9X1PQC0_9BACT|nr:hypothetical protein [Dyadobacter chenwenxiniae]MCF0065527.1 hypothetical protein [Dyadobacter chenwenxiniae]UON85439.1 hypothetical protein MUK70_10625 [Dyadobacter chenwenxiniae]
MSTKIWLRLVFRQTGEFGMLHTIKEIFPATSLLSRKTAGNQMMLLFSNAGGLDLADLENDIATILKAIE